MAIKVQELIEQLQDCDPDAEVRIAQQPSWALEFECDGVITADLSLIDEEELEYADTDEDREAYKAEWAEVVERDGLGPVVYIVEGPQRGYLPAQAAEVLGW